MDSIVWLRLGFVGLFVGVLAWFGVVDVYHNYFFDRSPVYAGYTIARVLFIAYLAWMQFYLGRLVLRFWQRRGAELKLSLLDEFIVCFYTGGALLAGITFGLGFLNLYYYWLFALGSIVLVALASAELGPTATAWAPAARAFLWQRGSIIRRLATLAVAACIAMLVLLLLAVKGLYPGGDHDYITHYSPYYRRVLQLHGLWPNDVWYQFFFSKGATIVLSSMLLTDMQAPETIGYLYFLVATACVYSLLRRCANNRIVPCLGAAACLGTFLWTVKPFDWGYFQKQHEQMGSLLMSVVWLATIAPNTAGKSALAWITLFALCAGHCVLHTPVIAPLVFVTLGSTFVAAWLRHARGAMGASLGGLVGAALVLAGVMSINYLCTGLVEITPMRLFWKYADQERFSRWVSPYLMVMLLEGSNAKMGTVDVLELEGYGLTRWEYLRCLTRADRLYLFFPGLEWMLSGMLIVIGAAAIARLIFWRTGPGQFAQAWYRAVPTIGTFGAALVLSQWTSQPASVFRCFSFLVFLSIVVILGLVSVCLQCLRLHSSRTAVLLTSCIVPALATCVGTGRAAAEVEFDNIMETVEFALGGRSLDEGYRSRIRSQRAVDSFIPNAVRKVIGREPRVYTLNSFQYGVAPGCELESFMSFALQQDYHKVFLEVPEEARTALKEQGLHYFLIDFSSDGDIDILEHAPLFQTQNIGNYLQLRWQYGLVYLLTWPGPDTSPLPTDFMQRYEKRRRPFGDLYELMRKIYLDNQKNGYPVRRNPDFPTVKGWQ